MMSGRIGSLLSQKRFGPFFWTQFFGAFNDNVFKNALAILIAFQTSRFLAEDSTLSADLLVNLCAGLFILPFFLFSATAGQIADKYAKDVLIRRIKLLEVIIMLLAALGFYLENIYFLISVLFLMGIQSAFFGPIKYAILPQHLEEKELIAGNAAVEMGTFVAILLGVIAGSKLVGIDQYGDLIVSLTVILVAVTGYLCSRGIPTAPASDANLKMNWNPLTETWKTISYTRRNMVVFRSILGISWFWFFGATLLTQLPNLTKNTFMADDNVFIILVALFSVGVAVGSILCEKLSGDVVEIGLVPIGSFMLTAFSVDLYFSVIGFTPILADSMMNPSQFFSVDGAYHIVIDILMIGVFGGFFIVPLYALVQQRSEAEYRSRIIAGNNILNALFMVGSAILSIGLLGAGVSIAELVLIVGVLNLLVAVYIFTLVPEFMMRCLIWLIINTLYRLDKKGLDNIPEEGAALIVCNHVSFVDALVIASCSRRPVRFVMYYKIFSVPVLNFIFRTGNAIPIAGKKENPELMEKAFEQIQEGLEQGDIICIFPEGKLTGDGEIDIFRPGVDKILEKTPVPVVPMALQGLWGSFFSRKDGAAMSKPFRRFWSKISLNVGEVLVPEEAQAQKLKETVISLREGNQ